MTVDVKKLINKHIKSKQVKNGIWMYLLQFFNAVIPMLTIPYITRVLGSSMYGVFSIALNIVSYMQVTVEYGFGMSATRKVAIFKDDEKLNEQYSGVIFSRFVLLFCCLVFSGLYILINQNNIFLCKCFCALLICLFGYAVQMNWLFLGKQEMKFISIANMVSRTISSILIFILVQTQNDIVTYSILFSISPLLSGIIGVTIAKYKYNVKLIKIPAKRVYEELKEGWFVFTTQLSSKVFGAIGITFLGIFATESEVGIFSAIQKIPNIMMLVWSPITQVLYPVSSQHMMRSFIEGKAYIFKLRKIFVPIFFIIALLVGIFSKFLVSILFGEEYVSRFYLIFPLLLWFVIGINNNFLGIQILLGSGHDKEYSKCFQISVVCTIILNFILIKQFNSIGAAFAPLITELILCLLLHLQIKRIIGNGI